MSGGRMRVAGWMWALAVAVVVLELPCAASIFGKDKMDPPQWGLDAAKTRTPDYAKDAPAIILYDEYVETIDAQGRAVEREREAIRKWQTAVAEAATPFETRWTWAA